jgi:hypothetical protein
VNKAGYSEFNLMKVHYTINALLNNYSHHQYFLFLLPKDVGRPIAFIRFSSASYYSLSY